MTELAALRAAPERLLPDADGHPHRRLETAPFVPAVPPSVAPPPAAEQRFAAPRWLRWPLRLLVLSVAVAAPVLAFAGQKEVAVDVEGRRTELRTYAAGPHELLERVGIEVTAADVVRAEGPLSEGPLEEGETVTYRRAKPVEIVMDEVPREVVAHGVTVGEALTGLGLRPGPDDFVSPALDTPMVAGMSLEVRNAIGATVRVDGAVRDVVSAGETVSELLEHADITVGENDYVLPDPSTRPSDGMWIRVVRVAYDTTEEHLRIPYEHVSEPDPELDSGERRVVQEGSEGLKVRTYLVRYEDGEQVATSLRSEEALRPARNHIVRVGTKEPVYTGSGNSQSGLASWYASDGLVGAHKSLPMGTVVKVTNVNTGASVTVRIADRGPYVDGRVIDLSDDAFGRVASLEAGTFEARIEW